MFKNKLMLPILAVIIGVAASAFTSVHKTSRPYDTAEYWYQYTGEQNKADRMEATNYSNPQISDPSCGGGTDECAVKVIVTLDTLGNPPTHPDFSGADFDNVTGIPETGGPVKANELQL